MEQQEKRTQLAKALRSVEEEIARLEQELREHIEAEAEAEVDAVKAEKKLQEAREQIAERTVDPDERKRLGEAMAALRSFENAQQQLERELRAFRKSEEVLAQVEQEAADVETLVRKLETEDREAQNRLDEHRRKRPWEREELEFRRRRFYEDARRRRVSFLLSELETREKELKRLQSALADSVEAERTSAAFVEALGRGVGKSR